MTTLSTIRSTTELLLAPSGILVSSRRRFGETRVTFTAAAIRAGYHAVGLPVPDLRTIHIRQEAMAYYTDDKDDADATATAMLRRALDYPESLIAERDRPLRLPPRYRTTFHNLLSDILIDAGY